jgi:L-2-hydroxycarboxylate dehydrogenase (NAD+)
MSVRIWAAPLRDFCARVFEKMGVLPDDAAVTADVLVAANLRGINSHGVARLKRYVNGLRDGMMLARPNIEVVHQTPCTALVDGGGGLGQPVGVRGMKLAISKAREIGVGFVAVRNSNHYGIAGYYSMMALREGLIGVSMTNASVLVVPTFGQDAVLGTNPISVAVPAGQERPFVLDMATSVATRGRLEEYVRQDKPLPLSWATDERGVPTADAARVLKNVLACAGGGILPLGGAREEDGGHKGYGLALLVDILCGVLPGAGYATTIYPKDEAGRPLPANVGHFFGAIRVDAFRPLDEFKATMDDIIRRLKDSAKAEGAERVYVHGEKEFEGEERRRREGIPLHPKTVAMMQQIAQELGVAYDLG